MLALTWAERRVGRAVLGLRLNGEVQGGPGVPGVWARRRGGLVAGGEVALVG